MKPGLTRTLTSVPKGISALRDDIDSAFFLIQAKLKEKTELLKKFESIEVKICEILKNSKEDDLSLLTSDQSDLLELINVLEYNISAKKDYIRNMTGKDFNVILESGLSKDNPVKNDINKLIAESVEIIKRISALKKINMKMLTTQAEDLSKQVRELEIMNNITIIPPKDL